MKLYPNHQVAETMKIQHTKELLEALISDAPIYPWSPYLPESEAYFNTLEDDLSLADCWTSTELETNANNFFASLERCWQASPVENIKASLQQQLGNRVPSAWLENIVNRAQEILASNLAPIEQLIECVKPLLSGWEDEDLQVFARPLVYAMRGNNHDSIEQWFTKNSWEELSQIEQIRLTMAIANYTLVELNKE